MNPAAEVPGLIAFHADVSGESRDDHGRWTSGGGSSGGDPFEVHGSKPASRLKFLKENISQPRLSEEVLHKELSSLDTLPLKDLREVADSLGIKKLLTGLKKADSLEQIKSHLVDVWEIKQAQNRDNIGPQKSYSTKDIPEEVKDAFHHIANEVRYTTLQNGENTVPITELRQAVKDSLGPNYSDSKFNNSIQGLLESKHFKPSTSGNHPPEEDLSKGREPFNALENGSNYQRPGEDAYLDRIKPSKVLPQKELESKLNDVIDGLSKTEKNSTIGMVPVPEVREAIEKELGSYYASHKVFDEAMLNLRRSKTHKLVSIDDPSKYERPFLNKTIKSVGEMFGHIEPTQVKSDHAEFAEKLIALKGQELHAVDNLLDNASQVVLQVLNEVSKSAVERAVANRVVDVQLFNRQERNKLVDVFASITAMANLLGRVRVQEMLSNLAKEDDEIPFSSHAETSPFAIFDFEGMRRIRGEVYQGSIAAIFDETTGNVAGGLTIPPSGIIPIGGFDLVPPAAAIDYFTNLVPELSPINSHAFEALARRDGFTLAVTTEQTLLKKVQDALAEGLKGGTNSAFDVQDILDDVGVTPKNPQYAEMVTRTNNMDAFNTGYEDEIRSPDVKDYFPVWQYLGIRDGRQGHDHEPHFDLYYPNTVTFAVIRGKRVYNCRCCPNAIDKYTWQDLQERGARVETNFASFAERDVSGESRDDHGRWTSGGGSSGGDPFEVHGSKPASRLKFLKENISHPDIDGMLVHKEISTVDDLPKKQLQEIGESLGIGEKLSSLKNKEEYRVAIKNHIVDAWEKSHSGKPSEQKPIVKSPLPSDEQNIIDDPKESLENRLNAAANGDVHTFDKIVNDPEKSEKFQAAGGENNEYFRNIFNNYRDLVRASASGFSVKTLDKRLGEMDSKIKSAISGLSAFPELESVANWYRETWDKLKPDIVQDIENRLNISNKETQSLRLVAHQPK